VRAAAHEDKQRQAKRKRPACRRPQDSTIGYLQYGITASGLAAVITRLNSAWIRCSACCDSASKRMTMTGVVFDERARPKPSGYSTRGPSSVVERAEPGNLASRCSWAVSRKWAPSDRGQSGWSLGGDTATA